MKILFDQGTPVPLREFLSGHAVSTAFERGWSGLDNGELLKRTEAEFDVLITTDKNLRHQQNIAGLRLAVLVLPTTSWPRIRNHSREVVKALDSLHPGKVCEVAFHSDKKGGEFPL